LRYALVTWAAAAFVLASCSSQSSGGSSIATESGGGSTAAHSTTETLMPGSSSIPTIGPDAARGLLLQSLSGNAINISTIDPSTGAVVEVASFVFPDNVKGSGSSKARLAPDLTRFAALKTLDGFTHAGWLDLNGNFTDVNAGAPEPDEFGGRPDSFSPLGFDGDGNFFFAERASGSIAENHGDSGYRVFKLPKGQSTMEAAELFTADSALSPGTWDLDAAGNFQRYGTQCLGFGGEWLNGQEFVFANGTQIYKKNAAEDDTRCEQAVGVPLLPQTNTSEVSNPIVSPDGSQVAFVRQGAELWTVSSSGAERPSRVATDFQMGRQQELIGWR